MSIQFALAPLFFQVLLVFILMMWMAKERQTALRRGDPPVIARIENDACCLDPRTVLRGEDETLIDAVEVAVRTLQQ